MRLIEEGVLRVEELVTHTYPLERAPEAYARLLGSDADFLGLLIEWRK